MARTAVEEMWGGTHEHGDPSYLTLPLPSGVPGASRFIYLQIATVDLPDARLLPLGGPVYVIWNNQAGGGAATVRDAGRGTVATLGNHDVAKCFLLDNSTQAGTWVVETSAGSESAAQTIAVDEFTIEFGPGVNLSANIRTMCNQLGYQGTDPARVNVFVGPQGSATVGAVGSTSVLIPGMRTGTFPAGSKIILTVLENGYITGRGGVGGTGQPITGSGPTYGTAVDGGDGGDGLHIECDTILFNYGRIQGGGGGGAGGNASGSISGPGGGGGAGHKFGRRGLSGSIPPNQGFGYGGPALIGVLNEGGLGGGVNNGAPAGTGGTGGGPGQNGSSASPSGAGVGTAGFAIRVASGVTLTKAVAGIIEGFEGAL